MAAADFGENDTEKHVGCQSRALSWRQYDSAWPLAWAILYFRFPGVQYTFNYDKGTAKLIAVRPTPTTYVYGRRACARRRPLLSSKRLLLTGFNLRASKNITFHPKQGESNTAKRPAYLFEEFCGPRDGPRLTMFCSLRLDSMRLHASAFIRNSITALLLFLRW